MPPLPSDSEGEESTNEEIILAHKPDNGKSAQMQSESDEEEEVGDTAGAEEVEEEEEEDDDDDEEAEVYQVEKIVSHDAAGFDDKQVRYQVKWLGYDKESEMTWELAENLLGAKDILQAYFDKIGGRPEGGSKASATKKRGRKSTSSKVDTPDKPSKKAKPEESEKKKDGRGRKKRQSSPGAMDLDVTIKDGWEPPKPKPGNWEEGVLSVQTIEGTDDGTKWAYLIWADEDDSGKKRQTKALLSTCYIACPQIMLKFFESHLVFTDKHETRKKMNGN
ncbi:hypothetical protein MMC13_008325 [Lambiella insularis]|nr:hypothetical protein [Lambiella insularis]